MLNENTELRLCGTPYRRCQSPGSWDRGPCLKTWPSCPQHWFGYNPWISLSWPICGDRSAAALWSLQIEYIQCGKQWSLAQDYFAVYMHRWMCTCIVTHSCTHLQYTDMYTIQYWFTHYTSTFTWMRLTNRSTFLTNEFYTFVCSFASCFSSRLVCLYTLVL